MDQIATPHDSRLGIEDVGRIIAALYTSANEWAAHDHQESEDCRKLANRIHRSDVTLTRKEG